MNNKLINLISKVMNISPEEINDESGPLNVENWTSFNSYVLLYELEKEFNQKFTMDEAMDVKSVADIKRHLKNHGIEFD
jgi:acyl carrier protein|tara:strand:+ start:3990 stop:4226 length:237 start_codon:yes stop_codon:yes gene_type:complete